MITIAATPPIAIPTISPVDKEGLAKNILKSLIVKRKKKTENEKHLTRSQNK
jgi:hypothetical protein